MRLSEEEIVRRYKAGESVTILTKDIGSSQSLYKVLGKHHVPLRYPSRQAPNAKPEKTVSNRPPGHLTGKAIAERSLELAPTRRWLYDYWKRTLQSKPFELRKALEDATGEIVAKTTLRRWLKNWREGKVPKAPEEAPTTTKRPEPIVRSCGIPLDEKDPIATVDEFFNGLEKLMAEVKQLRMEKEQWKQKAQVWATRVVEIQNLLAMSG